MIEIGPNLMEAMKGVMTVVGVCFVFWAITRA